MLRTAVQATVSAQRPRPLDRSTGIASPADPGPLTRLGHAALLLLFSVAAIAINGYHPYGEDAANHVAAIKQAIDPHLFRTSGFFVAPYVRLSMFAQSSAWIIRMLHLPIDDVLFALHLVSTWLFVYACFQLARQCFRQHEEQWAAVVLVATCLSIPLAGSSFFVMDPYLTGRSFSTPFTLLAIAAALDRRWLWTAIFLLLVALFHPLMSVYTLSAVLVLVALQRRSWAALGGLISAAFAAGWIIQLSQRSVVESAALQYAVATRYYVFLQWWHWYELVGLFAPLVLLSAYAIWQRDSLPRQGIVLAETCVVLGATAAAVCFLFCRPASHSHLIAASLQPMRLLQFIYISMFLLIGGLLARYWLKRIAWRWVLLFGGVALGLGTVQHQAYPASAQVELPWNTSANGWTRAFVWIRDNTPANAVFALDNEYIHAHGEDGQGFRAIAERDALADRSKDGGAAAVFPKLADRWMSEQTATANLNKIDDAGRLRRLTPFHVDWIVLNTGTPTQMQCPFVDDAVKVCRLPN